MVKNYVKAQDFEDRKVGLAINGLACYYEQDETMAQMVLHANKLSDGMIELILGDAMGYLLPNTKVVPGETNLLMQESQLRYTPVYDVCFVDDKLVGNVLLTTLRTERDVEPMQLHVVASWVDGKVVVTVETLDKLSVACDRLDRFVTLLTIAKGYAKAWAKVVA